MIEELIKLVAEIAERQEKLDKLFDPKEVDFVHDPVRNEVNRYMGTTVAVFVYSGIWNLADMFGAELVHPKNWIDGKEEAGKLAFVQGHTLYSQLGHQKKEYVWE